MRLSKLWEMAKDREAWCCSPWGLKELDTTERTEQQQQNRDVNLLLFTFLKQFLAAQVVLVVKDLPANAEYIRNSDLIPGYGRSPVRGHGNPL